MTASSLALRKLHTPRPLAYLLTQIPQARLVVCDRVLICLCLADAVDASCCRHQSSMVCPGRGVGYARGFVGHSQKYHYHEASRVQRLTTCLGVCQVVLIPVRDLYIVVLNVHVVFETRLLDGGSCARAVSQAVSFLPHLYYCCPS